MFRPECSTGTKRGTKFNNIKDPVKKSHQQDIGYYACPEPGCAEDYIGETGRRLNERVIYHNGRYKKSHLYKHSQESNHPCVALSDFEIIGSNFQFSRDVNPTKTFYITPSGNYFLKVGVGQTRVSSIFCYFGLANTNFD